MRKALFKMRLFWWHFSKPTQIRATNQRQRSLDDAFLAFEMTPCDSVVGYSPSGECKFSDSFHRVEDAQLNVPQCESYVCKCNRLILITFFLNFCVILSLFTRFALISWALRNRWQIPPRIRCIASIFSCTTSSPCFALNVQLISRKNWWNKNNNNGYTATWIIT